MLQFMLFAHFSTQNNNFHTTKFKIRGPAGIFIISKAENGSRGGGGGGGRGGGLPEIRGGWSACELMETSVPRPQAPDGWGKAA